MARPPSQIRSSFQTAACFQHRRPHGFSPQTYRSSRETMAWRQSPVCPRNAAGPNHPPSAHRRSAQAVPWIRPRTSCPPAGFAPNGFFSRGASNFRNVLRGAASSPPPSAVRLNGGFAPKAGFLSKAGFAPERRLAISAAIRAERRPRTRRIRSSRRARALESPTPRTFRTLPSVASRRTTLGAELPPGRTRVGSEVAPRRASFAAGIPPGRTRFATIKARLAAHSLALAPKRPRLRERLARRILPASAERSPQRLRAAPGFPAALGTAGLSAHGLSNLGLSKRGFGKARLVILLEGPPLTIAKSRLLRKPALRANRRPGPQSRPDLASRLSRELRNPRRAFARSLVLSRLPHLHPPQTPAVHPPHAAASCRRSPGSPAAVPPTAHGRHPAPATAAPAVTRTSQSRLPSRPQPAPGTARLARSAPSAGPHSLPALICLVNRAVVNSHSVAAPSVWATGITRQLRPQLRQRTAAPLLR